MFSNNDMGGSCHRYLSEYQETSFRPIEVKTDSNSKEAVRARVRKSRYLKKYKSLLASGMTEPEAKQKITLLMGLNSRQWLENS